jgi:hypothetical protein
MRTHPQYPVWIILPVLAVLFSGCKKSNNSALPSNTVPSDVIAEVIAATICRSDGGIEAQMELAFNYMDRPLTPGAVTDSSSHAKNTDPVTGNAFDFTIRYRFGRTDSIPPKFNFNYQSDGSFSTSYVSCTGTQQGSFTITNMDQPSSYCTMIGTGTSDGTYSSKDHKLDFSCNIQYQIGRTIELPVSSYFGSGTLILTATGTGTSNVPYHYAGAVYYYQVNGEYLEFLFNGVQYQFNVITGTLQKY